MPQSLRSLFRLASRPVPDRCPFFAWILSALACAFGPAGCVLEGGGSRPLGALTASGAGPEPLPGINEGIALAKGSGDNPILFRTGLEDQSQACWGDRLASGFARTPCDQWSNIGPSGTSLAEGAGRSGGKALAVTFDKNESRGGATLTFSSDVVNVRAWYNFTEGFDFGQGIKVGRVRAYNRATQANDIDIIMTVRSSGDADQCGLTGMADLGLFYNGAPVGRDWGHLLVPVRFERGRWYAVEYQVVLNTPGSRDGSVGIWVDGKLQGSKTGLDIRGNTRPEIKLNKIMLGGWYSNSALGNSKCADPSQPSTMLIDDVAVGTEYIGSD